MSENKKLLIPVTARQRDGMETMPNILQSLSRGATEWGDDFLGAVLVDVSYSLAATGRGDGVESISLTGEAKLLALEARDGTTVFIRSDRLQDLIASLYPEALNNDQVDLSFFRERGAASRGLDDWLWSTLTTLSITPDAIIEKAKAKALEWAKEWVGDQAEAATEFGASWLGAKALMWAIESRLAGEPGIYHWKGGELKSADYCRHDDARLVSAAQEGPILLFIHGTASHTVGGFGGLGTFGAARDWEVLKQKFGDRIFGFEHRTFSESPIDNALALAETLPAGATLSLVTHSRGGLVGDLICLGNLDDALIAAYRRGAPANHAEKPWEKIIREKVAQQEQDKLRKLRALLETKSLKIERYVRVAAPARGTTLLSDNLDIFLSGLLNLIGGLGHLAMGPAATPWLSAMKRIVLEVAEKRIQPHIVPGIEAMLSDAPMGRLLARAPRRQGIKMAVIAGDIEGGGMLKRIGVMFTDWMFFDNVDNDLVVDTSSMFTGLAKPNSTHYLYDRRAEVNHFNYFGNRVTRAALRDWLTTEKPEDIDQFSPLLAESEPTPIKVRDEALTRSASRGVVKPDSRPVVILLPGIMGSHLEIRKSSDAPGMGNRIWLDIPHLMGGGLETIRIGEPNVQPEAIFEMFYGDVVKYLEDSHTVIPFPYDWRMPIQKSADDLAEVVKNALHRNPNQPVRLLAHSMGGLVARAMIAQEPGLWEAIVARPGGRLLMLGTPNNGSHMMVEALLGKSDKVRNLARFSTLDMAKVLDIISEYPGAIQLLPKPGFKDTGNTEKQGYYLPGPWAAYKSANKDFWFGDGQLGMPSRKAVEAADDLWKLLDAIIPHPDRVAYVHGKSENTPCGVEIVNGRVKMIGTPEGDGTVSWTAGQLRGLEKERYWFMPVAHGSLLDSKDYFPGILELLQTEGTTKLERLPASRGTAATYTYDAGPVPYPNDEELVISLMGAAPRRRKVSKTRQRLVVSVTAMDLRYVQKPVICGHYLGDPIAGAEALIDEHIVGKALSQREHLGVYAGHVGTTAVVLMPRSDEELQRGSQRGAVIVGLGKMGELSAGKITETVRAGMLRLLMHSHDRSKEILATHPNKQGREIAVASLLIGYNSTANMTIDDSVAAVVRGVCEANKQYADTMGDAVHVGTLEFIELYRDSAIAAARAVAGLSQRMQRELDDLGVVIQGADELREGTGVRERLSIGRSSNYWPQLIITDADRNEESCAPECYRAKWVTPIPEDVVEDLVEGELRRRGIPCPDDKEKPGQAAGQTRKTQRKRLAERLKYIYLSERARAESVVQQRQPGLVEKIIETAIQDDAYKEGLSRTLFQLMVPLDFKAAARDAQRLVLVVDSYTANLPWEMLQIDDKPMVLSTRMVRQLVTGHYRRKVRSITRKAACIIANPSTAGFETHFGRGGWRQTFA